MEYRGNARSDNLAVERQTQTSNCFVLPKYLCSSEWDYPSHKDLQLCKILVGHGSLSALKQYFSAFNHRYVCFKIRTAPSYCSKQIRRNSRAEFTEDAAKHDDSFKYFRKGSQSLC